MRQVKAFEVFEMPFLGEAGALFLAPVGTRRCDQENGQDDFMKNYIVTVLFWNVQPANW